MTEIHGRREPPFSLTAEFLRKYDVPGPRYTSYPPAPHFRTGWSQEDLQQLIVRSNQTGDRNLSFYVHIPFCPKQCLFCGCTTEIGKPGSAVLDYFQVLDREMDRILPLLDRSRPVSQIHFGGGTPNAAPVKFLAKVIQRLLEGRILSPHAEIAIECDPNLITLPKLADLRQAGFNRISFGLQDFNLDVLSRVNRPFPRIAPADLISHSHGLGFTGVNLDLIYGLPGQTRESFLETVQRTLEASPDRVATFSYAHVPWAKDHQKTLESKGLPDAETKIGIAVDTFAGFVAGGYHPIGMDHYAKPDDELSRAQDTGELHRNFQGYCSKRTTGQVVGFGASAISQLHEGYIQNVKESATYGQEVVAGKLPVERAYILSREERFDRDAINSVMCRGELDLASIGAAEGFSAVQARERLAPGLERLEPFVADGLCTFDGTVVRATSQGRFAVRNIAFLFDPLLGVGEGRYSRTV
ncbi:MAG: oxygen-independent coproporphyrinogen III oxidase [Fibrobacterota bacterium]|nr:oxygen-independent coproporphyrinogen III oxidase [Fibrobacterota bacterium]QQS04825.1 MAG: oxygen-independent coproporphyrinogen III oxidase [Fibrobacterota bacterium]